MLDKVERATRTDHFSYNGASWVACPEPLGDRLYGETKDFALFCFLKIGFGICIRAFWSQRRYDGE